MYQKKSSEPESVRPASASPSSPAIAAQASPLGHDFQSSADQSSTVQRAAAFQSMADSFTGHSNARDSNLPGGLRSGAEQLGGVSLSGVKVHYNSSAPAQLQAHAFAKGNDIHLAPGQERHLPHETWHVVQQKQNRVRPTTQLKGKVPINDDPGLEREADVMGARALNAGGAEASELRKPKGNPSGSFQLQRKDEVVQRLIVVGGVTYGEADQEVFEAKYDAAHRKEMISAMSDLRKYPKSIAEALADPRRIELEGEEDEEFGVLYTAQANALPRAIQGGFVREAGGNPELVTRPDQGIEVLEVAGMIMCIGVFIEAKDRSGGVTAVTGAHFVTPDCVTDGELNAMGTALLNKQLNLIAPYGKLTATLFHVANPRQMDMFQALNLITPYLLGRGVKGISILAGDSSRAYELRDDGSKRIH